MRDRVFRALRVRLAADKLTRPVVARRVDELRRVRRVADVVEREAAAAVGERVARRAELVVDGEDVPAVRERDGVRALAVVIARQRRPEGELPRCGRVADVDREEAAALAASRSPFTGCGPGVQVRGVLVNRDVGDLARARAGPKPGVFTSSFETSSTLCCVGGRWPPPARGPPAEDRPPAPS